MGAVVRLGCWGLLITFVTTPALGQPAPFERWVPSPPGPPLAGPGSEDYSHERVTQIVSDRGAIGFYLAEPAQPRPKSAPVVVFIHGYSVTNPRNYAGWITHLVRRGNTVIYPVYQTGYSAAEEDFAENALQGVVEAFDTLQRPERVQPEGDGFFLIGHSLGASIAAYIAGEAEARGLPPVRALLLANPGDADFPVVKILDRVYFEAIPADVLMLAVVGDQDRLVTTEAALRILEETPHIAEANKVLLGLHSDDYGWPPLVADHAAAGSWHARPRTFDVRESTTRIDALDFYGYWKWCDAMMDMVIFGVHREYAYGGTSEQTFMGVWSDGTPLRQAEVLWP